MENTLTLSIIVLCVSAITVNILLFRKESRKFERCYTIAALIYTLILYTMLLFGVFGESIPHYLARPMNVLLLGVIIAKA